MKSKGSKNHSPPGIKWEPLIKSISKHTKPGDRQSLVSQEVYNTHNQ